MKTLITTKLSKYEWERKAFGLTHNQFDQANVNRVIEVAKELMTNGTEISNAINIVFLFFIISLLLAVKPTDKPMQVYIRMTCLSTGLIE